MKNLFAFSNMYQTYSRRNIDQLKYPSYNQRNHGQVNVSFLQ